MSEQEMAAAKRGEEMRALLDLAKEYADKLRPLSSSTTQIEHEKNQALYWAMNNPISELDRALSQRLSGVSPPLYYEGLLRMGELEGLLRAAEVAFHNPPKWK